MKSSYSFEIVVQTDGIYFGMYSQRPFEWYMTTTKAENNLATRKTIYLPRYTMGEA